MRILPRILLYGALALCAVVMLTPLVWLLAASVKGPDDLFHYLFFAPKRYIVSGPTDPLFASPFQAPDVVPIQLPFDLFRLEFVFIGISPYNFRELFRQIPFLRFLMNSFFVTGTTVMVQLFFASLGGFALAKYEFRGKKPIMILMLATMMIPGQVMLAPLYELIYRMGFMDSYLGLIVPGAVSVFGMFLFRQSMLQIPDDLLQAGRIDGCSEFGLYWNIALPVSRPMIGAFCLISFMGNWNSFLWPQIILHTRELFTLPIGLNQMVGLYHQEYGVLMAGTLLSILPVIILFFVLQKEFISGLTAGAMKG